MIAAEDDVGSVRPFIPELGRLLSDENPGVTQTAGSALTGDMEAYHRSIKLVVVRGRKIPFHNLILEWSAG